VERIRESGVESVAVVLIHSYRSPEHERRVGQIVRMSCPRSGNTSVRARPSSIPTSARWSGATWTRSLHSFGRWASVRAF
jgi:hypothetical protein